MSKPEYHIKLDIPQHRIDMTILMSNAGIAPLAFFFEERTYRGLKIKSYQYNLNSYKEADHSEIYDDVIERVYAQADILVDRMHSLASGGGYIHGDLWDYNIVFNLDDACIPTVRFTNFADTIPISKLTNAEKLQLCQRWDVSETLNIKKIKAYEKALFRRNG